MYRGDLNMVEELSDFEKSVLGDSPATITQAPVEEEIEVKEAWETMPIKELRKYYKTQMHERRAREAEYIEQREKCKKIREHMKVTK